jgi:anti-sigma-K factor RskA
MTGGEQMHTERRDDLAAYALGALDTAQAAEVEEHVAGCQGCAEYLRWLQPAVDLLPASVEQLEPPASLRASLMREVRADAAAAAPAAAERPRRRWNWSGFALRPATVLAAVVVLAAGLAVGYVLSDSGGPERERIEAHAVGSIPAGTLAATLEHGAGGDAILHVQRAPAPENGDVYQTWVSRGGTMEPAASFTPHEDGTQEVALGDSLDGADAVLVTEEPSADEQQPTSPPILRADIN